MFTSADKTTDSRLTGHILSPSSRNQQSQKICEYQPYGSLLDTSKGDFLGCGDRIRRLVGFQANSEYVREPVNYSWTTWWSPPAGP